MKLFLIGLAVFLTACTPKAEREYGYDNIMPTELKDCKVFSIYNGTKELYVTRCGLDTITSWTEYCGKNCTRQMNVALVGGGK